MSPAIGRFKLVARRPAGCANPLGYEICRVMEPSGSSAVPSSAVTAHQAGNDEGCSDNEEDNAYGCNLAQSLALKVLPMKP